MPMVPLPDGSGTYVGAEGLVETDIARVSNMVIQVNIAITNCGKGNIARALGNGTRGTNRLLAECCLDCRCEAEDRFLMWIIGRPGQVDVRLTCTVLISSLSEEV